MRVPGAWGTSLRAIGLDVEGCLLFRCTELGSGGQSYTANAVAARPSPTGSTCSRHDAVAWEDGQRKAVAPLFKGLTPSKRVVYVSAHRNAVPATRAPGRRHHTEDR